MTTRWYIEVQNIYNWDWERQHPTLDGVERVFKRRKEAESYAYEYELAGGRNQFTRYVKVMADTERCETPSQNPGNW